MVYDPALSPIAGHAMPRLYTRPLRKLTRETSFGYEVVDFARDIGYPFDPWQRRAVIRGCELLPNGLPRFRKVLIVAARQNGKTHIPVIMSLYWLFKQNVGLVLLTNTIREYAKANMMKFVEIVEEMAWERRHPLFVGKLPQKGRWVKTGSIEVSATLADKRQIQVAASSARGGRSLTVHRAHVDELREHHDYTAWGAIYPAMNAVPDAQVWITTNAGDVRSVVLNDFRAAAIKQIVEGGDDNQLCLLEWSCEMGDNPLDLQALAKANPNLGHRLGARTLLAEAKIAVDTGGEKLTDFLTEYMCITVPKRRPIVDPNSWGGCCDPGSLDGIRGRVVAFEISPSLRHATLAVAAQLPDGRVRVEIAASWDGPKAVDQMRKDLAGWMARIRPRAVGWLPEGPAAAFGADVKTLRLPIGVKAQALTGEVAQVCMGFVEQIESGMIAHSDDELLNDHVAGAERLKRGDAFIFSRAGKPCDAAYAAAGAVHLARTLPKQKASDSFVSV